MRRKILGYSLIFVVSFLSIHVLFFASQLLSGYILTVRHVPDIVEAYDEVVFLQNEVTFGVISTGVWFANPLTLFALMASIILTIGIYWARNRVVPEE